MAITRTQIAKQLLANGGRTGFFTGMREQEQKTKREQYGTVGQYKAPSNKPPSGKGEDKPVRRRIQEDRQKDFVENPEKYKNFGKGEEGNFLNIFNPFSKERQKSSYNLSMLIPGQTARSKKMQKAYKDYLERMGASIPEELEEELPSADFFVGPAFDKPVAEDAMLETPQSYGEFIAEKFGAPGVMMSGNVGGLDKFVTKYEINPDGTKGKPLEFGYRQRDDYGEGRNATSDYERRLRELEQSIAANPITSPVDDEIINYRLMADGGTAREQYGTVGQYKAPALSSPPSGKGEEKPTIIFNKPPSGKGENNTPIQADPRFNFGRNIGKGLPPKELARFFNEFYGLPNPDDETENTVTVGSEINTPFGVTTDNLIDTVFSTGSPENVSLGTGLAEEAKQDIIKNKEIKAQGMSETEAELRAQGLLADGGRAGLAGGGMPYEGGIMDLESARQMYGLGKLVKKVTRGIKKIAKSPIGKAALAFGTYKLGGGFLKDKGGISGIFDLIKANPYKSIFGLSALSGLMSKEEEEEKLNSGADLSATPRFIMDNPQLFQTYRTMAEGGSTEEKEPVAKKVMPLLDMDGQEKDYRETGGFVDMGRMEKADDVPARLSKNEFVFTADAVRNAGDGSVDKGAEVMYNMMKNLESGGEVSEESQGLEGAREMFKTSQRLEEVL